jgi:hypothetical protein
MDENSFPRFEKREYVHSYIWWQEFGFSHVQKCMLPIRINVVENLSHVSVCLLATALLFIQKYDTEINKILNIVENFSHAFITSQTDYSFKEESHVLEI